MKLNEEEQFEELRFKKGTVFYEKKQLEDKLKKISNQLSFVLGERDGYKHKLKQANELASKFLDTDHDSLVYKIKVLTDV